MMITTGTVVEGKVVIGDEPLPEGSIITVLAAIDDGIFTVPPALEAERDESFAEAARGETVSIEEALQRLSVY